MESENSKEHPEKHNVKFNYLYRDAGNYKTYGSVVFANPNVLSVNEIEIKIRALLISSEYFIPSKWNVPFIYFFSYDSALDHEWYEYESCEYSEDPITDLRTIEEFLKEIDILI